MDSVLIQEVILNLVENAIKYTPIGGQVFVKSMEVDDRVIVIVQDSGVEFVKADQRRFFEKFQKPIHTGSTHKRNWVGSLFGKFLLSFMMEQFF